MSKREALGTNPTVKREVALGMKTEPPAKQVKTEVQQEPEERHGRLPENLVFKNDPVKLERMARMARKRQRMDTPVEEAQVQLPSFPIVDPQVQSFEYTKPKRIGGLPTVAHNYTFWGDLVIAPNSRNTGMVLFVRAPAGGAYATLSTARAHKE